MRVVLAMCACAVLGCGDEGGKSETPAQRLSGHWASDDSASECMYVFSFDGVDYVELKEICELTDGSVAIVLDSGTYNATANEFTWHATESTCSDADTSSETIRYTLEGDKLTLVTEDGVLIMRRIEPSGGSSGIAEFGCFDDEGYFDPSPLRPL